MRPLEVWGTTQALLSHDDLMAIGARPHYRQCRAIVAARSRAEAGRLLDLSPAVMRDYASTTGNDIEVEVATAEPGVVFVSTLDGAKEFHRAELAGGMLRLKK